MGSKQDTKRIDAWQAANVDKISIKSRKSENLPELLEIAVASGFAPSRQAYILEAIREKLNRDEITLDKLHQS